MTLFYLFWHSIVGCPSYVVDTYEMRCYLCGATRPGSEWNA